MSWHKSTSHSDGGTTHARDEADVAETVSEAVINALAEAEGVGPVELDQSLNDSIDPDALDGVFAPRYDGSTRTGDGHVKFSSNGYRVTVAKNGEVRLDPHVERSG